MEVDYKKLYELAKEECKQWARFCEDIENYNDGCGCCGNGNTVGKDVYKDKELQESISEHNKLARTLNM